jgi:hypothetical protein
VTDTSRSFVAEVHNPDGTRETIRVVASQNLPDGTTVYFNAAGDQFTARPHGLGVVPYEPTAG